MVLYFALLLVSPLVVEHLLPQQHLLMVLLGLHEHYHRHNIGIQ
jgi:hypothetical protein